ncbi:hypothetical protein DFJ58DRAFT_656492 [Suillus subalutaceus]|uniref:uncharacterized protein n=1 Tax=Suillus subalutaceus TaxID=48586 RepID=UPI001B864D14|nr:uncharacterized protein DFJ58DRAFT_656584 [Suillus subalutaceus]XP_041246730.1 uncharacterized protein DFJ58DRAFT_656492 [Suillus subalutaceus]KAG1863260.1 hypothetical protein DFJ58DRAFT_656584 [Suillus subalutaceus]KAG1863263.1 hypothetical protein DFJ58DRAFT_656492 [Suillus subalutaceus]
MPKWWIRSRNLFAVFCEESDLESLLHRVDWVRQLVSLFDSQEVSVRTAAWQAFDIFVKSVPKDEELHPPSLSLFLVSQMAAYAIGNLVEQTEESATKPFMVPFTRPLICVATQATTHLPGVKTAIFSALASMLERIPGHIKLFFPQLWRMFVKTVSDASSTVVQTRAADALGILMHSQPRVDPVVMELIAGVRASEETAASFVLALRTL